MRILFNSQGIKAIALLPLYPRQSNSRVGEWDEEGFEICKMFDKFHVSTLITIVGEPAGAHHQQLTGYPSHEC